LEPVEQDALAHQAGQAVETQYLQLSQQLVEDVVVIKLTTLVQLVVLAVVAVAVTVAAFKPTLAVREQRLQFKVLLVVTVVTPEELHLVVAVAVALALLEGSGAMKSVVMVETD
jgi:hypothetical protein